MIVYVDVDETICITPDDRNYANSVPIKKNIKKINKMYDNGDEIVYWTARGTVSGIDWTETTKRQLKEWGAKHHDVKLGKPHFDMYICDKSFNAIDFFKHANTE